MTKPNQDGRTLIIDTGDLPSLTAIAIQDRPERCALWHPVLTDEAAPRRAHTVAEHAAIYAIDDVIEFPIASLYENPEQLTINNPANPEEQLNTTLWSILLLAAGWSASQHHCSKIVWPINLGHADFQQQALATELQGIAGHTFDLSDQLAGIAIDMPFIDLEDWQLIDLAARTEAPLRACWWCRHDAAEPCTGCNACRRWHNAFKQANIESPWQTPAFK